MDVKKLAIGGILLIIVLIVVIFGFKSFNQSTAPTNETSTSTPTNPPSPIDQLMASASGSSIGQVKEFTLTGSNYKFSQATLTVNKADKVKITFSSNGGTHDFVIDEFNVKTKVLQANSSETVEFTADRTGTFDFYCSVGNHRAMGMVGKLTVN